MIRHLFFGMLIFGSTVCQAQFAEIISVRYQQTPLRQVLHELSQQHDIRFSYGNSYVPLDEEVTISVEKKTLKEVLIHLFAHLKIDYITVENHVVLRSEPVETEDNSLSNAVASNDSILITNLSSTAINSHVVQETPHYDTHFKMMSRYGIDTTSLARSLAPPNVIGQFPHRASLSPIQPRSRLLPYALGLVVAVQDYRFHFAAEENQNQQFQANINYSTGLDAQWYLTHRLSLEAQLLYSRKNFWLDYNHILFDLNDPVAIPGETHTDLTYLDIPVMIRYDWLRTPRFVLSTHVGVMIGRILRNHETTHFLNDTKKTSEFFSTETNRFLWGGTAGIRAAYQASPRWQLHVEPTFLQYQNKVNDQIMRRPIQSLGINVGLSSYLNSRPHR